MRDGLNGEEINRVTRLLRGGEAWADVREQFDDVAPEVVDRFRTDLERKAAKPGQAERLPAPEESRQNQLEQRRLDALFHRGAHRQFKVRRAIGR